MQPFGYQHACYLAQSVTNNLNWLMSNSPTFAQRLLIVRQERGMKRSEVAERIGSTGPAYGRYERGERVPSIETAKIIADALGVSLDYLVGDAPEPMRDRDMIARIEAIAKLTPERRSTLLDVMDAYLRDSHTAKAYAA